MKKYGGVLLIYKDRFLLGQRSEISSFPNCWSLFGGKIEEGETILEGVKRELFEETGIESNDIDFRLFEEQWGMGYPYYFYVGFCNEMYECKINEESKDWGWFDMDTIPKPLFPTLFSSLLRIF